DVDQPNCSELLSTELKFQRLHPLTKKPRWHCCMSGLICVHVVAPRSLAIEFCQRGSRSRRSNMRLSLCACMRTRRRNSPYSAKPNRYESKKLKAKAKE